MELSLEFSAVIRLYHHSSKRQSGEDIVDELNGCSLIVSFVHPQDPKSSAIIDGSVLIVSLPCTRDLRQELHINMDSAAGFLFFMPFSTLLISLVALIIRQMIHI